MVKHARIKRCLDCNARMRTENGDVCDINIVYCSKVKYIFCPFAPWTIWDEKEIEYFKKKYKME